MTAAPQMLRRPRPAQRTRAVFKGSFGPARSRGSQRAAKSTHAPACQRPRNTIAGMLARAVVHFWIPANRGRLGVIND